MFLLGFILGGLAGIIIEALLVGGRDEWRRTRKVIWFTIQRYKE